MRSELPQAARAAKHRAYLAVRKLRTMTRVARDEVRARTSPFTWSDEQFAESFAGRQLPADPQFDPTRRVPRVIYGIWAGDNAMSANRRNGWDSLIAHNPGIECILVTPDNLADHFVDDFPLHPAYEFLSLVHRSDYLRCYLMHVHGGGYSDIKPTRHGWAPLFDQLDADPRAWALGYPEAGAQWVGDLPAPLADLPRVHHRLLIGDGAFIMKARSPLTQLWFDELHRRMDYYADDLRRHGEVAAQPAQPYPIRWTGILGDITGGVLLRYHDRLLQAPAIKPVMKDYR